MYVRQTIELRPNNKQKTYFRQCFGARRLAYNYGLKEWIRRRDAGEKTNCRDIRAQFNAEKAAGRWPFLSSLSSAATCFAFEDLKRAFDNFFNDHEKIGKGNNSQISGYPQPKSKTYNEGSYTEYFTKDGKSGGARILDHRVKVKTWRCVNGNYGCLFKPLPKPDNANTDKPYLLLPRIGTVKMTRPLRYEGRPVSVTIRQHNECFYACFLVEITEDEFYRTHPRYMAMPHVGSSVGIDLGIKDLAVTSDGLVVENPRHWERQLEHENRLQEQMNRCEYTKPGKGKRGLASPGKNFLKAKKKLWRVRTKIRNKRQELRNKFCSAVLTSYQHIGIETLGVKQMAETVKYSKAKKELRKHLKDVALYEIRHRLETLGELLGRNVKPAPKDFRSTRTCCRCGFVAPPMNTNIRTYHCPKCGNTIDRDLNAAINLRKIIGRGTSDSMPQATERMRSELIKSNIPHRQIGEGK